MPPERDTELAAEVSVQITGPPDQLLGARISGLMDAYQQPRTEAPDGQD